MSYFKPDLDNSIRERYRVKKQRFVPITAPEVNAIWQMDLFFIKTLNIKIVLSVIDIYSRKGWIVRLPNKKASSVLDAFQYAVKKIGGSPQKVMIDSGSEFKQKFKEYLKDNNIAIRISKNDALGNANIKLSQGIVERFNKTMRDLIVGYREQQRKQSLTQVDLDKLSEAYNKHKHSTLGYSPNEIVKGMAPIMRVNKYHMTEMPFAVGDKVRVMNQSKSAFKQKDKPIYSDEVFKVEDKSGNRFKVDSRWLPYTRLLKSDEGVTVKEVKVKRQTTTEPRRSVRLIKPRKSERLKT